MDLERDVDLDEDRVPSASALARPKRSSIEVAQLSLQGKLKLNRDGRQSTTKGWARRIAADAKKEVLGQATFRYGHHENACDALLLKLLLYSH